MPIETFPDYRKRVIKAYNERTAATALSHNLIVPTPGRLKDECAVLCQQGFSSKDEKILRDFFGKCNDAKAYLHAINHYDTDRFRPLVNFLRDNKIKADVKNINLLALLIDFKDRPFEVGKNKPDEGIETPHHVDRAGEVIGREQGALSNENSAGGGRGISTSHTDTRKPLLSKKAKFSILIAFILVLMAIGTYWFWSDSKISTMALSGQGCMYWAGDHYEPISCSQRLENTLIIALDSLKLRQFKKITCADTITQKSKGLVWYAKVNKKIEFYTADGFHPVDIRLRLKPITDYIIKKYVDTLKNENAFAF